MHQLWMEQGNPLAKHIMIQEQLGLDSAARARAAFQEATQNQPEQPPPPRANTPPPNSPERTVQILPDHGEMPGNDSGNRKLQAKRYLLTYKTHINKESLKKFLLEKAQPSSRNAQKLSLVSYEAAHESGDKACPYLHTHAVVEFDHPVPQKPMNTWDYPNGGGSDGTEEVIHPHIRVLRNNQAKKDAENYLAKEDPNNQHLRKGRNLYTTIVEKSSIQEAMALAERPGDFLGIITAFNTRRNDRRRPMSLIEEKREWQQKLLDICNSEPDDRSIWWIYDRVGNAGKSAVMRLLTVTQGQDSDDWRWVCHMGMQNQGNFSHLATKAISAGWSGHGFMVDIARQSQKWESLYSNLEAIKNGMITSGKYEGANVAFASPHVIVFANFFPSVKNMSADRWKIVELVKEEEREEWIWTPRSSDFPCPSRALEDNECGCTCGHCCKHKVERFHS